MAIITIRTAIIYLALLVMMRLLGKRQLGEMELSEFVVAALAADLASHPLQDLSIPLINGLIPIATLFCMEVFIALGTMKSVRLRSILFGKPGLLVKNGCIVQQEMEKNRFTPDELMQELRNQGCLDISKVQYAILETDGRVNVIKFPGERTVSASQMNICCSDGGYPVIVISDGKVNKENLRLLKLDQTWLAEELHSRGIERAESVFLMTVNQDMQCYISKKENTKC